MSYPKIFLTRPWRRGIFYFLVGLFFIISPLVIMYTAGYRYDWTTKRIQATGVLSIDVSPRDTHVLLGETPIGESQANIPLLSRDMASYELKNRAPGTYKLTLTNPGYHTFVKDISIQSNQTTYVRDVRLLPKTLPIKLSDLEFRIEKSSVSPSGRYVLLTGHDEGLSVAYLYDTERETLESLVRDQAAISVESWSPRTEEFILVLSTTSSDHALFFSAEQEFAPVVFPFEEPVRLERIVWPDPKTRERAKFFVSSSSTIFSVENNVKTAVAEAPTNTWAYDGQGFLWREHEGGVEQIVNGRVTERYNTPGLIITRFLLITDSHLLVESGAQIQLISRQNKETKLFRDVADSRINSETSKAYIASGSELWAISPTGETMLLNRLGSAIQSITPLPRFSSVALFSDKKILLIREDDLVTTELFSGSTITELMTTHRGNHLTFLFSPNAEGVQLYSLPLVK